MEIKAILSAILLVGIFVVGGYFFLQNPSQSASLTDSPKMSIVDTGNPDVQIEVEQPDTHEVIYTADGFTPATLTIKIGDTITFKNQSASPMWVGSAMHPSHMAYGGMALQNHCPDLDNSDFDQCMNGTEWSFTFNKIGAWGYHNHSEAKHFGKIIVE